MVTHLLHHSEPGKVAATWTPAVVLVIDDDEHFRAMARSLLEQAGMSVLEAGSVQQGLNRMQCFAVDVVILDLVMPDEDGITGLRRIKAAHAGVKLIAVSGAPCLGAISASIGSAGRPRHFAQGIRGAAVSVSGAALRFNQ